MSGFWNYLWGTTPSPTPTPTPIPTPTPPPPPPTLLDKPWRETDGWSSEVRRELRELVAGLAPEIRGDSLKSVFLGKVVSKTEVGDAAQSLTREFRIYNVRTATKNPPLSWTIWDTMGLDVAKLDDMSDVRNILKAAGGHVPDGYKFKENEKFDDDNSMYIGTPSVEQKAHCVAVVVDASSLRVMHNDMWKKLRYLRRELIDKKVPTFILLTHIDEACEEVGKDVTNVFRSIQIRDYVKLVGKKLLGLPENQVFPVKSYSDEINLNANKDILLLYALRQMLYNAQEHLENQMESNKY